jgi:hypothetical protein
MTEISAGIKKYLDVYLARVKANPQLPQRLASI